MNTSALVYQSVGKSYYGVRALDSVNLEIQQGEIFGLIGPDGAGKTTLIRTAMGIISPDKGSVQLLGGKPSLTRSRAGYVAQSFSLYTQMTVMENIRLFAALYGGDARALLSRTENILRRTRLWEFRDRYAGALSGGMKQKLALASGLVHVPKILFLDEPTTGVDPVARREFWAILYELNREGLTVFVSTPYMEEADLCTRMLFLYRGRVMDQGTGRELLARYPHQILEVNLSDRKIRTVFRNHPSILDVNLFGTRYHLEVENAEEAIPQIRALLRDKGYNDVEIRPLAPSLEDLFVSFARKEAACA